MLGNGASGGDVHQGIPEYLSGYSLRQLTNNRHSLQAHNWANLFPDPANEFTLQLARRIADPIFDDDEGKGNLTLKRIRYRDGGSLRYLRVIAQRTLNVQERYAISADVDYLLDASQYGEVTIVVAEANLMCAIVSR